MGKTIKSIIYDFPEGKVFKISDVLSRADNRNITENGVRIELSRLYREGNLKKYGNGNYYFPKRGIITEIPMLKGDAIYQKYISDGVEIYGIYTGQSLLYSWNLSQQIPSRTVILTNKVNSKVYNIKKLDVIVKKACIDIDKYNYKIVELIEILKKYKGAVTDKNESEILKMISWGVNTVFSLREQLDVCFYIYRTNNKLVIKEFERLVKHLSETIQGSYEIYKKGM